MHATSQWKRAAATAGKCNETRCCFGNQVPRVRALPERDEKALILLNKFGNCNTAYSSKYPVGCEGRKTSESLGNAIMLPVVQNRGLLVLLASSSHTNIDKLDPAWKIFKPNDRSKRDEVLFASIVFCSMEAGLVPWFG